MHLTKQNEYFKKPTLATSLNLTQSFRGNCSKGIVSNEEEYFEYAARNRYVSHNNNIVF